MHSVTLPWPPKKVSPNAREHWAAKSRAAKSYREICAWECKAQKLTAPATEGRLHLWVDFFPPDFRCRDDDNVFSCFKSARDGIADAIGVNDSIFIMHPMLHRERRKGGEVRVKITTGPDG